VISGVGLLLRKRNELGGSFGVVEPHRELRAAASGTEINAELKLVPPRLAVNTQMKTTTSVEVISK
jgi:hypothetical protein